MYEQTQNNRQRSRFLKIFIRQNPNPLKQFGKHYLDRGSVHASEIGCAHAKFSTKSISNRGTFCNFSLAPKIKIL